MMKPKGTSAWWTASLVLGLLAGGLAIGGFTLTDPVGWLVITLAVAAIACAFVGARTTRAPRG